MTEPLPTKCFEEPAATELEQARAKARLRRRIPYDCYNAIVDSKNPDRVVCKKRHRFGGITVKLPVVSILRGRASKVCQSCFNYDDGGESGG